MKYSIPIYLLATIIITFSGKAQVSHGGSPLPFVQTKSSSATFYVTMPSFDIAEELRIASAEDNDLRGSYRFAHKFITNYNRSNSGESFSLSDGTKIWRMGIYSKDALSINILFTEYELPEGAQVFLYNMEQTHILGSFTHLNNSDLGILPISPVRGDKLIIEYHEPADAAFPGRLTIGEVNHAFRDLRGYEPGDDRSEYHCMPSPICFQDDPEYDKIARSVVLITIDGILTCTGVLLNNTLNDGKPYLLTASHCLNEDFKVENPDYESVAERIICFFNYQSPTCENIMRGTEEMSVVSASYKAVNEKNDMALLELLETPPAYYQPYYAGWSIEENSDNTPYANIHHPYASVKRVNISEDKITLKTFSILEAEFYKNVHWNVSKWTIGSTAPGSSGSPLFDVDNHVIGALSGGMSTCNRPIDDFYFALSKAWESSPNSNEQLKYWLDPANSNKETVNGLDPWQDAPAYRLSNLYDTKQQDSIEVTELPSPAEGNLFGSNTLGTQEYAEAYTVNEEAKLYGAYFVTPSVTDAVNSLDVEVTVYSGKDKPETLLYSGNFRPTYTEMSIIDSSFIETKKRLNRQQESFIRFDKEITVSGAFYIGYKIKSPAHSSFAVYNLPKGKTSRNTAWYVNNGQWTKASAHSLLPFNTSLFIDPVIQYTGNLSTNIPQEEQPPIHVFSDINNKSIHVLLLGDKKTATFALYSMNGQLMYKTTLTQTQTTIPMKNLESGIYIINIKGNNIFYNQKVLF